MTDTAAPHPGEPGLPAPGCVLALGAAQTLAWGSTYYLPAMLAGPMARSLGVSMPTVFAAFSGALVVSALVGPWAGRRIDRRGGRELLMATSLMFAAGLAALGAAQGLAGLLVAWLLIGLAMGAGLYDAAFATLVRLHGSGARGAITGVTLMAGFASTLGWPLSATLEAEFGWRVACWTWAGLHLLVGLPLNASLPRATQRPQAAPLTQGVIAAPAPPAGTGRTPDAADPVDPRRQAREATLLAFVFAVGWFTSTAMAAHLPGMMQATGASLATAVAVGALIGPAQVAARLAEFGLLRQFHPLHAARLAALAHPLGVAVLAAGLLWVGPGAAAWTAPVFALLHGAGNGILTITKGTLPLALFGAAGYGVRQGWLGVPARIAQAFAPWAFGLALARWQAGALALTAGLGLLAFWALWRLQPHGPSGSSGPSDAAIDADPIRRAGPGR